MSAPNGTGGGASGANGSGSGSALAYHHHVPSFRRPSCALGVLMTGYLDKWDPTAYVKKVCKRKTGGAQRRDLIGFGLCFVCLAFCFPAVFFYLPVFLTPDAHPQPCTPAHPHTQVKRRFVVLTHESLHWFKRAAGYDLFGEERGSMSLGDISSIEIYRPRRGSRDVVPTGDGAEAADAQSQGGTAFIVCTTDFTK